MTRTIRGTINWPIPSWGRQKVCSFCTEIIAARYDQLPSLGWFAFVPMKGGDRQSVIIGCPEHIKVAEEASLLWLRYIEHWGQWPTLNSYMEHHGFTVLEPKGRGDWDVGVPQLFFRKGDKDYDR